jgi:CubicO group peptidase (beta-lactamase class C family)
MDAGTLVDGIRDRAVATSFSGVVHVEQDGEILVEVAFGDADRAHGIANRPDTQFGIASGGKGLTALAVMSLCADGVLSLATTARSVLGDDLPLVDDRVTVEHLLAHRSGIGDYLPEGPDLDITDYAMPLPAHALADMEQFVAVLDGHATAFAPDTRFEYCNGGYVVLALIAERAAGTGYHDLVLDRVCAPAAMRDTAFIRSDELPGRAALGYLGDGPRTNVHHLPVRGTGDGGIYSTGADVARFWRALFDGRIVDCGLVAEMVRPRSDAPELEMRYGLGFWLHPTRDIVMLEGYDAGVSFRSVHDPARRLTHTVLANTSEGAWPIARHLRDVLDT